MNSTEGRGCERESVRGEGRGGSTIGGLDH